MKNDKYIKWFLITGIAYFTMEMLPRYLILLEVIKRAYIG